jgi:hypothetical protein
MLFVVVVGILAKFRQFSVSFPSALRFHGSQGAEARISVAIRRPAWHSGAHSRFHPYIGGSSNLALLVLRVPRVAASILAEVALTFAIAMISSSVASSSVALIVVSHYIITVWVLVASSRNGCCVLWQCHRNLVVYMRVVVGMQFMATSVQVKMSP